MAARLCWVVLCWVCPCCTVPYCTARWCRNYAVRTFVARFRPLLLVVKGWGAPMRSTVNLYLPLAHPGGHELVGRRGGYAAVADLDYDVHHFEVVLQLPLRLCDVPWIPYRVHILSSGNGGGSGHMAGCQGSRKKHGRRWNPAGPISHDYSRCNDSLILVPCTSEYQRSYS